MAGAKQTYSQQEVTEILKRALRQQSLREQELGHDDLVQMAGEVGIDKDALERATTELAQSQAEDAARTTAAEELSQERGRQLARFSSGLLTFLVAGAVLFFVNKQVPLPSWVYWVVVGWGVVVLLRLRHVMFPHERLERRKKREARWLERQQRRAQREAWKNQIKQAFTPHIGPSPVTPHIGPSPIADSSREFESAVQAGVAALLGVAARKIQEHADRKTGRRSS